MRLSSLFNLTPPFFSRDCRPPCHRGICAPPTPRCPRFSAERSLAVITIAVAACSEYLTGAIEPVSAKLGWSQDFIGLVLLPIVGNAAEHLTGAWRGWRRSKSSPPPPLQRCRFGIRIIFLFLPRSPTSRRCGRQKQAGSGPGRGSRLIDPGRSLRCPRFGPGRHPHEPAALAGGTCSLAFNARPLPLSNLPARVPNFDLHLTRAVSFGPSPCASSRSGTASPSFSASTWSVTSSATARATG